MNPLHSQTTRSGITRRLVFSAVLAFTVAACCGPASAQANVTCTNGHRVIARRWDAVLRVGWELRQDCTHPGWPARMVAIGSLSGSESELRIHVASNEPAPIVQPLLVCAGDRVRLWMQDDRVRIEMSGVAEQSARNGERVSVRITQQIENAGLTTYSVSGIVRGAGEVEMER
jgi:hypothetical protein